MSWVAIGVIVLAAWLALKAVGTAIKLLLWAVVLGAAYWLVAPHAGLPWPGGGA